MSKTYKGRIFSGLQVATTRVEQNIDIYKKESGMDLVPGTLNVRLTEDFVVPGNSIYIPKEKIKPADKSRGIILVPAKVESEAVLIMVTDPLFYDSDVIEIMAPFHIRNRFGFADGDEIEVAID